MTRRRTPFVWLEDQPVDHQAMFAQIHGGPLRRDSEGGNRWILARGRFMLEDHQGTKTLDITVDGRFRAWINGTYLGGWPVRSNPAFQRSNRFDIEGMVGAGENLLALLIHVPGRDLGWYETTKGGWQPVFGDGGLFAELKEFSALVPLNWRMVESRAWMREAPPAGWGQDNIEVLDGRQLDAGWELPGYDDSAWPEARIMRAEPSPQGKARGWGPVEPFPCLIPSATGPLVEYEIDPERLCWCRLVIPQPALPVRERLYAEELDQPLAVDIEEDGRAMAIATPEGRDLALLYAFTPYRVGRPFIELTAHGGEVLDMALAEALPGEFGKGAEGDGLRREDHLWVAHIARYIARPGRQRFEWFNPTGIRALQIVLRDAPGGIKLHRVGLVACHHDANPDGAFCSGDAVLDAVWAKGRHTVLMCAQDGWIDCPGRESRQWLGDGAVMFDMAAYAFGSSIYALQRQFLDQIAEGQRADGLARMVSPGDLPSTLTIPDYTLHWLIAVGRYLDVTGDMESVEDWLPAIEKALDWIIRMGGDTGLVADVPEWHFIEWADLGREGWSLPFNALCSGALNAIARVAVQIGQKRLEQLCSDRSSMIREHINRSHWDEARGLYVDSVDPETGRQRLRASQHGNALALLFDLALPERVENVLAAITDRSRLRLTDAPPIAVGNGPFDDAHDIVRANSFFSHFVYDAIARAGRADWVFDEIRKQYGPMLASGATTLWESFEPVASLCHGFSATPVYQLSRHMLGITPAEPGYRAFRVTNAGAAAGEARGTIPTRWGAIDIVWSSLPVGRQAQIEHPAECRPCVDTNNGRVEMAIGDTSSKILFYHR